MNTTHLQEQKPTALDRISQFLTRHRKLLAGILIVAAVAVVALFVVLEIASNRTESALVMVEDLQESYSEWVILEDEARAAGYEDLAASADEIADAYPRLYAAQRALYIKGQAMMETEQWGAAAQAMQLVASRFPDSYLAPIALTQAAVSAENAEDADLALEILSALVEEYDTQSAEIPRALFSIGRINETKNEIALAADSYNRLIEDYPASSWTNLARDRIITLTVQGRIGS